MARKPTDYVQFKLRIRESLRRKIERVALRNAKSANAAAVDIIDRAFEQEEEWARHFQEMEADRDEFDAMWRAHEALEARRAAMHEASLRDTKILNMMMHDRSDSVDLLRGIFLELEHSPGWAGTSENKKILADRVRLLIMRDDDPPNELLSLPLKGDKQ
jgi:hypothetical protein